MEELLQKFRAIEAVTKLKWIVAYVNHLLVMKSLTRWKVTNMILWSLAVPSVESYLPKKLYVTISWSLGRLTLLGFDVGLHIKLSKQEEKRQNVHNVGGNNGLGQLLASIDEQVGSLRHHCKELNHLHQS